MLYGYLDFIRPVDSVLAICGLDFFPKSFPRIEVRLRTLVPRFRGLVAVYRWTPAIGGHMNGISSDDV